MVIITISAVCFILGIFYERALFNNSNKPKASKKFVFSENWANYLISILAIIIGAGITLAADNYASSARDKQYVADSLSELTVLGDDLLERSVEANLSYIDEDYSATQLAVASFIPINMYANFIQNEKAMTYISEDSYYSIFSNISYADSFETEIEKGYYDDNKVYTSRISSRNIHFYKALILMRAEQMRFNHQINKTSVDNIRSEIASQHSLAELSNIVNEYDLGLTTYKNRETSDEDA